MVDTDRRQGVYEPVKDSEAEHPVPSAWRGTLSAIVNAFCEQDYGLSRGIPSVAPPDEETERQIGEYIADYGETLAKLPDESWNTSVSQWVRDHWNVLVDLWTVESGRSDMVLSAEVFETDGGGFRIEIYMVYVP